MCLVDDDERGTCLSEALPSLVRLDVVQADDGAGIGVEEGLRRWKTAFKARRRGGGDGNRVEVEPGTQFHRPLVHEVRRTKHGEPVNLATVVQLTHDQACLDRLAHANIVSDQQAGDRQAQRHEDRNQLIGARLDRDARRRTERSRSPAQRKAQRIG